MIDRAVGLLAPRQESISDIFQLFFQLCGENHYFAVKDSVYFINVGSYFPQFFFYLSFDEFDLFAVDIKIIKFSSDQLYILSKSYDLTAAKLDFSELMLGSIVELLLLLLKVWHKHNSLNHSN